MSDFDDASLVMIPSGYKNGKVYSVKPTDGTGDLTFTRASSATRVASNGLIEKVRTNLVPNGLLFNIATGVLYTTEPSDTPISGVSSTRITKNEAAGTLRYGQQVCSTPSIASNTIHTISRFFKYDGFNTTTSLEFNNGAQWGVSWRQDIDIASTGITLQAPSNCTSKITNVGSGWYRVDVTIATGTVTVGGPATYLLKVASALSTGEGFLTAAPQLETGDIATDYIPTTTAAVSVGPVANVPRLDYLNSSCPRLLLEPQRTNSFQYSEQLDNAYWSKIGAITVTANNAVSPDGYQNADLVTGAGGGARIQRAFTGLTAGTRTLSCFVKAGTGTEVTINTYDGIVDKGAVFNVVTGVVTSTSAGVTATITNYGSGWYRLTHIYTSAGTSYSCQFFFDAGLTYQVYGFQFEDLVSYATSYIPTLAASVTRVADACTKTGISSLIGQTEGTLFLDFESGANDSIDYAFTLNDGTTTNRIRISRGAGNTITAQIRVAAVTQALIQTATVTPNTRFKCALAYKLDDVALYVNGAEIGVDTSSTIPACSVLATNLGDGTGLFGRPINQVLLFKTRLTNAQLAELTAL